LRGSQARAVAGVRPEDCKVTGSNAGKIAGKVYATGLMGDHGASIGVDFAEASVHVFDKDTRRPHPLI